jgi:hypothetical protein
LPGLNWREWIRARGEAERRDRHWPEVKAEDWSNWNDACVDAEREFAVVHGNRVFPPPGEPLGEPGSVSHAMHGGRRRSIVSPPLIKPASVPFQILPAQPQSRRHLNDDVLGNVMQIAAPFEECGDDDDASDTGSIVERYFGKRTAVDSDAEAAQQSTEYCLVDSDGEEVAF